MRFPTTVTSIEDCFELGFYAACAVAADDETAGLETGMASEDKAFRAKVAARDVAKDGLTMARAKQAVPRRRIAAWYRQLERDAKAAYGGNTTASGFRKLFPRSAAKVLLLPLAERYAVIAAAVVELADPAQPKALQAFHKAGLTLVTSLAVADGAVAKAQKTLDDAIVVVHDARTPWLAGYRSLHAGLTLKFPSDKERVESYFMQPAVARVKKPAANGVG